MHDDVKVTIELSLYEVQRLTEAMIPSDIEKRILNKISVSLYEELDRYDTWSHETYLINKELVNVLKGVQKYV